MNPAMWIAKTGLEAQQTRMAVITNNIANVNTTGFKRDRAIFEDLLYQNVRQVGANSSQDTQLPSGLMLGTGVHTIATEKLHTQGNLVQTGNAMDLAINGRGFFQIQLPDGTTAYTRDGSFQINQDGQLVTSTGYQMSPSVTIPQGAQSVTVSPDGIVTVMQTGSSTPTQVGSLQLADFINPAGLQAIGKNLFLESGASGSPQIGTPGNSGVGTLVQGSVESSNVNVVEELVAMIETQRAYEMNSKSISTVGAMLQYLNNNV